MVKAVFDEMKKAQPKNHFTIGIHDDVTHTSLDFDTQFSTEDPRTVRALFYGLGSDGTVGANKNSIKIIGKGTKNYAQGYFVYDSKKAGSVTVSHLRFGPDPIRSSYLITEASFVACHQFQFIDRMDVLAAAQPGATFLLNAPFATAEVWDHLPRKVQETILQKKLKFYVIDAYAVARGAGMGNRINTIMQTCFFAISGVLPREEAIAAIKKAIQDTYGKRGDAVVNKNFAAVDQALSHLHEVQVPANVTALFDILPPVSEHAPAFVRDVLGAIIAGRGDSLPVSAMPLDGSFPTATAQWEKRNIAQQIPVWDTELCIQCGKCVLVCPHAVIRAKVFDSSHLSYAPQTFKSAKPRWRELESLRYSLQVAPEDCTGCRLCVEVCPAKSKSEVKHKAINMEEQPPLRQAESVNWDFFLKLPEFDRERISHSQVKDVQLLEPLFEFSGACAGCGETPYIKLLTQLFGDRLLIANATGCSSIYGGNLPTTPYTTNGKGRGPSWSNSLFEDNAEFGLGMRLAVDQHTIYAQELVGRLSGVLGDTLAKGLLEADQSKESGIEAQRLRVAELKLKLASIDSPEGRALLTLADVLVRKSVWLVGGDGWAYDIGAGGLDHVLGSGRKVNVLVLDTEVYSNTGGQMSKATPRGAVAKFATGGKQTGKKDLAMEAISYGSVYVARVAMGGSDTHTVKAFLEAEAHDGPFTHHRLQPLHRAWLRHGLRDKSAEGGCAFRLLAADPLQPGPAHGRKESFPARFESAEHPAQAICLSGGPLHDAGAEQSSSSSRAAAQRSGRRRAPVARVRQSRRNGRPGSESRHSSEGKGRRCRGNGEERRRRGMSDLTTNYLGLTLKSPLVASASPICESVSSIRQLEDAGIGAVVLPSLFEEQIELESFALDADLCRGAESFPESSTLLPDLQNYNLGPDGYLDLIVAAKEAVDIPIIASLNGISPGGWAEYARLMAAAGADAIELNIYSIPTEPAESAVEVEKGYVELVRQVKRNVRVPVAVKLSPFFSAPANMAVRLAEAGANGLVLFNRFYQPDFDVEALEVVPSLTLSHSDELLLRLHWTAILFDHVRADLAITGGVHNAMDVLKCMMAGARVAMMTSALLRNGIRSCRPACLPNSSAGSRIISTPPSGRCAEA